MFQSPIKALQQRSRRPISNALSTTNAAVAATKQQRQQRRIYNQWIKAPIVVIGFVVIYGLFATDVPITTATNTNTGTRLSNLPIAGVAQPPPTTTTSYDPAKSCDYKDNIPKAVYQDWNYMNQTLHDKYPTEQVSGGIFLYPRQTAALTAMIQQLQKSLLAASSSTKTRDWSLRPFTICETGFGSGHSASLFAHAVRVASSKNHVGTIPAARIVSFDKFDRPYQVELWKYLNDTHASTKLSFDYFKGDSCKTVPMQLGNNNNNNNNKIQCDVLHGSSKCGSDNIDLVANSPCGVLLTSTAMLELTDRAVYFGPRAQWRQLRAKGCITEPICVQEAPIHVSRDFIFAKQGALHVAKWCVAMTTGKCSKHPNNNKAQNAVCDRSDIAQAVTDLELDKLCPDYRVSPPA